MHTNKNMLEDAMRGKTAFYNGKTIYNYKRGWCDQQKHLFLPIIPYTLSSTKLEIRAK
jgi:hypothetical protein